MIRPYINRLGICQSCSQPGDVVRYVVIDCRSFNYSLVNVKLSCIYYSMLSITEQLLLIIVVERVKA